MNKVKVLDCTLRDGGYVNDWKFGHKNIKKIISRLVSAGIDIVECGYLTEKKTCDRDYSQYNSFEDMSEKIGEKKSDITFVCMVDYGQYDVAKIPEYDGKSVDGIRVAFHKKNIEEGILFCEEVSKKGYKVFVQPMVSLSYTDEEFLELIEKVNRIMPYAFYIVDSFGVMKAKDLMRLFWIVENNLESKISIGYHAHNNMQLAYSNAQQLLGIRTNRKLIIDVSVLGMGRGAGNLNTELFLDYLNDNLDKAYEIKPIMSIIDEVLNEIYLESYWGYSLPHYISAVYNCHPNYATYLADKNSLTVEDIDTIVSGIKEDRRYDFDKNYIEAEYMKYMKVGVKDEKKLEEFIPELKGRKVLLIAPGKSAEVEREKICRLVEKENMISISINYEYPYIENLDYIFISNLRRFREISPEKYSKVIATSNISEKNVYIRTDYTALNNDTDYVKDNAGMMALKFLIDCGIKEVYVAGIDGYSIDIEENYADEHLKVVTKKENIIRMNAGMEKVLNEYKNHIKINFVTIPKHLRLG